MPDNVKKLVVGQYSFNEQQSRRLRRIIRKLDVPNANAIVPLPEECGCPANTDFYTLVDVLNRITTMLTDEED